MSRGGAELVAQRRSIGGVRPRALAALGLQACAAGAEDGHMARAGAEAVLVEQALAHGRDECVVKLSDGSAALADEVMVEGVADELELRRACAEICLGDKPNGDEQVQRAINGGEIDGRRALGGPAHDLVGGHVTLAGGERFHHQQALRRYTQAQPA